MKSDSKLDLGDVVKDTITGFTGVVIAKTYWLNGCLRLAVQPNDMKDGKPIDCVTFDVEQLELVTAKDQPKKSPGGGPMPDAVR